MSTPTDMPGGRAGLRRTLAAVLAFDVASLVYAHFFEPPPDVPVTWQPAWLQTLHHLAWPVVVLGALAAIGIVGLARGGPRQAWFGLLALVSIALLVESWASVAGHPRRRFFSTGAALAGWLAGCAFGRARAADTSRGERLAETGALAALAATYVGAAIQKLLHGGLFEPLTLRAHILIHHHVDDDTIVGAIAYGVARSPAIAWALVLTTVVVQLGAWILLVGPRARMGWGFLLVSFHLGTLVFLHIFYVEAAVLLVAWCVPWGRLRRRGAPDRVPDDPVVDRRTLGGLCAATVAVIALAWLVPAPHVLP